MKHTRKKIYAGLLAALLALSLLAGCGGGNPSGEEVGESQSGGDARRNSPGGPSEPSAPRPVIGLTHDEDSHYDDDLNALVNRMETELPGSDADTHANYPELAAALDRFREEAHDAAEEDYQAREEWLPDFIERGGNGGNYELYGVTSSMIRRADAKAVSVVNVCAEYPGGTHANYSYAVANFDAETGEEIALESLLADKGAETLNERIGQELDALYPDFTPGEQVADYALEDYMFSIEPDGVTFWFNPGEIASYVHGLFTVKLYFIRDADILNDTYENADSSWFVEFGDEIYRFAAANGDIQTVETWPLSNPSWSANGGVAIEFDAPDGLDRWDDRPTVTDGDNPPDIPEGRTIAVDSTNCFSYSTFYAHIPHGDYVVAILDVEDGERDMLVYRANGELVQHLYCTGPETFFYPELPEEDDDIAWDDYDLYYASLTNPDDTRLYSYSNMFGSWQAGGSYRLTDSGFQLQQDLLYGKGFTLTFMQDFAVTRCDPDNWLDVTGEKITIPEGTEVDVVAVDPEQTTAYFRVTDAAQLTNDDKELIFALSYDNSEEWSYTVNGIAENDLFDGLQYAG